MLASQGQPALKGKQRMIHWCPVSHSAEGWQLFRPVSYFGKGSGSCTCEELGPQQCQEEYLNSTVKELRWRVNHRYVSFQIQEQILLDYFNISRWGSEGKELLHFSLKSCCGEKVSVVSPKSYRLFSFPSIPAFQACIQDQEQPRLLQEVVHLPSCACRLPESSGCCRGTAASQMCSLARENKKKYSLKINAVCSELTLIHLAALGSHIILSDVGNAV